MKKTNFSLKIFSVITLFVFLFSILPGIFAQNESDEAQSIAPIRNAQGIAKIEDATNKTITAIKEKRDNIQSAAVAAKQNITRAISKAYEKREELCHEKVMAVFPNLTQKQAEERCGNILKNAETAQRKIAIQKIQSIKEKLEENRNKIDTAKNKHLNIKDKLEQARNRINEECINKSEANENCRQIRNEIRENARGFLLNTADMVISAIEKIELNIESSQDINQTIADEMLLTLSRLKEEVLDASAVIENIDSNSTDAEIRAATKTIRQAWAKTRPILNKNIGILLNSKIKSTISHLENLQKRLAYSIEDMQSKGADTAKLKEQINELKNYLNNATESYENAKELFESKANGSETQDALKNGKKQVNNAKENIIKAQETLRNIVRNMKQNEFGSDELENVAKEQKIETDISELDNLED